MFTCTAEPSCRGTVVERAPVGHRRWTQSNCKTPLQQASFAKSHLRVQGVLQVNHDTYIKSEGILLHWLEKQIPRNCMLFCSHRSSHLCPPHPRPQTPCAAEGPQVSALVQHSKAARVRRVGVHFQSLTSPKPLRGLSD